MNLGRKRPKNNATFSEVAELLDVHKQQLEMKEILVKDWFDERDVDLEKVIALSKEKGYDKPYPHTEPYPYTDEDVLSIFAKLAGEKTESLIGYYEKEGEDNSPLELKKRFVKDLLDQANEVIHDRNEYEELTADLQEERKNYADYMVSEDYDKRRLEYRDHLLQEVVDRVGDLSPSQIAAKKREARVIEERFTLEYFFEDLDHPTRGIKNREVVVNGFFDKRRNMYLEEKFRGKCEQLGLNSNLREYLLNIEENFLEEEFHVFNNLFLFYCMQGIAYSTADTQREAKQPIQDMINLVYNKFYNNEIREQFLEALRSFLRRFEEYRELFNEKNTLHPGHPYRQRIDAERAAMVKLSTAKQLVEEHPEAGYTVEDLMQHSLEDLLRMIDEYAKKEVKPEPIILEDHPALKEELDESFEEEESEETVPNGE